MDLENTKQIVSVYTQKEANMALARGYILKKILSAKIIRNGMEEIRPCFILIKSK